MRRAASRDMGGTGLCVEGANDRGMSGIIALAARYPLADFVTTPTEWWAECFPQWKGKQHMTTPNGQPSVQPSPRDLGQSLQDPSMAQTQASATGRMRSGDPSPKVVGDYMTDVDSASTEGATVANDQSELNVTAPRGPQT
jgi:hypothetical protein